MPFWCSDFSCLFTFCVYIVDVVAFVLSDTFRIYVFYNCSAADFFVLSISCIISILVPLIVLPLL